MPHAERIELQDPSGSVMADLQAGLATLGPKWGLEAARRHLGRAGARRPGAGSRRGALDRRAGRRGARRARARGRGRPGRERGGAVPDPLARRGRPAARRGDRHLLGLGGRARAERLDVHGADRRLDRRRLRARRCRRRSARSRARCTAARRRACCRCSTRSRRAAMPTPTSRACSIAASGSWASATASTAPRIRGRACFGGRRASSARRASRSPRSSSAPPSALREKSPDRCSRRTSSSGRVVLEIARSADVPGDVLRAASPAGRRTSSSSGAPGRLIRPSARYVGAGPLAGWASHRRRDARRGGGEAAALADAGDERELAELRAKWDDELEAAARSQDFRERAVAYRAIGQFRFRQKIELLRRGLEDASPACRGSALLSLELLSRDHPSVVNGVRPLLHEMRRRDDNDAVAADGARERVGRTRHDRDPRRAPATTRSASPSSASLPTTRGRAASCGETAARRSPAGRSPQAVHVASSPSASACFRAWRAGAPGSTSSRRRRSETCV